MALCLAPYVAPAVDQSSCPMFVWQAIYRLSHHLSPCIFLILAFYHVLAGKDIHTILQAFCNHWHASFSVQRGVGTECIGVKWFRGNDQYGKRQ